MVHRLKFRVSQLPRIPKPLIRVMVFASSCSHADGLKNLGLRFPDSLGSFLVDACADLPVAREVGSLRPVAFQQVAATTPSRITASSW